MNDKHLLDFLIGQIGDLLKIIQEHQGPISQNLTPETFLQLDRLEKAIQKFEEINQQAFDKSNVNINRLRVESMNSSLITTRDKQFLEKAKKIEDEAKLMQYRLSVLIHTAKNQKKEGLTKDQKKQRRNKFKSVGSNKKWIPL